VASVAQVCCDCVSSTEAGQSPPGSTVLISVTVTPMRTANICLGRLNIALAAETGCEIPTNAQDGQVDDLTGEDAGAESEYGHGAHAEDRDIERGEAEDPSPTSEAGRSLRPSPDGTSPFGRSGPS